MSPANWPPANDDDQARVLAELVRRDAGSPSIYLNGDEESTIRDLEAKLDTLVSTLREPPPLDDFAEESDCRRATELVKRLVRESETDEMPFTRIGPYTIEANLGQGGMGSVYKAVHDKLKRVVAIKILSPGRPRRSDGIARFEREMAAIGSLHHPNIVAAHDAAEVDGMQYLVMEYVDGLDLSTLSRKLGPLAVSDACEIVRQAAKGLHEAHRMDVVHRDMKPSNLMLASAKSGSEPTIKILDFGLALLAAEDTSQSELTATNQIMGTLNYMAPEQGSGSHAVDVRADVYSLGATLYRLLTGQPPFADRGDGSPWALITALATEEPTLLSSLRADLPQKLVALVNRMMAKQPEDRFASAAEVAEALAPWGRGADLAALLATARVNASGSLIAAATNRSAGPATDASNIGRVGRNTRFPRSLVYSGFAVLVLATACLSMWSAGTFTGIPDSREQGDDAVTRSREVAEWLVSQRAELTISTPSGELKDLRPGDALPNNLNQLVSANCDGNKSLSDSDLVRFDGLPLFTSLGLSRTNVGNQGVQNLGELPLLEVLFLVETSVGDRGLETLERYPRLAVLHLYGTQVTDAGLKHLASLHMLTDLSLVDCGITDRGLQHLTQLKRLEILALDRTGVTPRGVAEMRLALPTCTIRSNFTDEEIKNAAQELDENH